MGPAEPASADSAKPIDAAETLVKVQVAYGAAERTAEVVSLSLPTGATVAIALQASGLLERHGLALTDALIVGVWMKIKPLDTLLRDRDRVEIYRPLKVDPKESRRLRYRKHVERLAERAGKPQRLPKA
jgi:putative ubiquitin-RnfH superfamily antitoxin RatB of RatAB toxin-antitoxin module